MAKTKNKGDTAYRQPIAENEPTSDIIFILDKMELILRAVTEIEKDGRYRAEIAEHSRRNTFLKIDRNSNMLENFLKNFWSQLKDPTTRNSTLQPTKRHWKISQPANGAKP